MPDVDQPVEEQPSADLNENDVVSQITKAMDTRFSGFQSILDKNISGLRTEFASQLQEVKRSQLTPEERDDLEESERDAEMRRLKRENELLKLRKEYPDEVDFLSNWLEKDAFEDQLVSLSEFRNSNRPAEPTPREELEADESGSSPVDLNNPSRKTDESLAALVRNAGSMTREQATKLLQATDERGIMARLRRES